MKSGVSLSLLILAFTVYTSEANYEFIVRFYEFRNPLGLQCGACESGGLPACCDDVQRNESCNMTKPFTCDTRFRFLLRMYREPVETAPSEGFPRFTPSHGGNSETFNEGPGGLVGLPNPFTINSAMEWTGRIQFFIDALDRVVTQRASLETEAIINRFPIDLELELGANFTERTTYTGIYNISDLGFDMSFRVQCSENYYGPDCTTFCEPMEGVYTCNSEGRLICLQGNQTLCIQCLSSSSPLPSCAACLNPSTNCTTCHSRNLDPSSNCTTCIAGQFLDPQTNCTECVLGYDPASNCNTCLDSLFLDPLTDCTECVLGYDPASNCNTCLDSLFLDPLTDCTECVQDGYDPASNCTICLPNFVRVGSNCSRTIETTDHIDGGLNLVLVVGVAGGGSTALVLIIVLLSCIIIVIILKKKKTTYDMSDAASCLSVSDSSTYTKKADSGCSNMMQHDFKNPLYGPGKAPATAHTTNDEQYPLEQLLEVPNPFYGEFPDSTSQVGSKRGSQTSLEDVNPRSRLDTFPYIMDGENVISNSSTPHHQQRERVKHVVYETADINVHEKPARAEDGMYEMADKVCGKPAGVVNGMYETADKVRGKPGGVENGMYETANKVRGKPMKAENCMYEMADNVCGKSAGVKNVGYETADNVCGKPARAEGGKKESGVVIQGEEYDDIKTSGTTANVYDDIVSGKKSTDAKVSSDTSAMYDDIQTNNTSAFYDVIKVAETPPLYDDVTMSKSLPSATDNYEYDDIKVPGKASTEAAAKPNSHDTFTCSGHEEQPFDNEVYNAPFSPPPPGASFIPST